MKKKDIDELINSIKELSPYDDTVEADSDCYSESDYIRGYEEGYEKAYMTVITAFKLELHDDKYTVKGRRSRK